jgi:shikimate kinase
MQAKTSSGTKKRAAKNKSSAETEFPPLVLLGFMAAGKTSVAAALAEKSGCKWIDLDELIEASEGKNIAQIFEAVGETVFREIETETLKEVLSKKIFQIVALGGGTWTIEDNRRLAKESGFTSVWLDAPFELCWERIKKEKNKRPLATKKTAARKLFVERQKIYEQTDLRVEVAAEDSPEDSADKILKSKNWK